jgi:TolB-like protein
VMEYVPGDTVAERTAVGPFPPDEIRRLGTEIAEALGAAHERSIVHRDLSAANVIITRQGHAKVMDFGLAGWHQPHVAGADAQTAVASLSSRGLIMGTPAYLAPEVLRGGKAGPAADFYALGVLLYLMATGRLPFVADTTAALAADVLTRVPPAPRMLVPGLPWRLEEIILRLLTKDSNTRPATAAWAIAELYSVNPESAASCGGRSVAVMPFKTLGSGAADAELGVALADATITELASVKSLLVRPTSAILCFRDGSVDSVQAGRQLSVDAVVDGSLQRSGQRLRVTVQVLSTSDGRPLWGGKIDATSDDLFRLQDEVARRVVEAIQSEVVSLQVLRKAATERNGARAAPPPRPGTSFGRAPLEAHPALVSADRPVQPEPGVSRLATFFGRFRRARRPPFEADALYARGRVYLLGNTAEALKLAIDAFERALAVKPEFAKAYAGLAAAYARMTFMFVPEGDYFDRAHAMTEQALAIDRDLPEARYLRGLLAWTPQRGFDHATALREGMLALGQRPGLHEAREMIAGVLAHVGMFEESIAQYERALSINPHSPSAYLHFGFARYLAGDFASAREISRLSVEREASQWGYYQLGLTELQSGNLDGAARAAGMLASRFPSSVLQHPLKGLVAARRGNREEALQGIELTVKHQKGFGHYHHVQYDVGCIHAQLGVVQEGLDWIRNAAEDGFPCSPFFDRDPLLAPLRDDPRYSELTTRLRQRCAQIATLYRDLQQVESGSGGSAPS